MAKVVLENIYKTFSGGSSQKNIRSSPTASAQNSKATPTNLAKPSAHPNRPVLNDINLTVEDGEFMVLVGPSGCGKSTLLRLISGLETITGGNVWVGDRKVNTLPPKQRDIAMVFQSYALYPHLSVYDNLAFGLRRAPDQTRTQKDFVANAFANTLASLIRPLPGSLQYQSKAERAIAQRIQSIAQMLQIEDLLTRLPKQLSGGQKQRVALGRAMARSPQVFLMDEPLSNLDAKLRTETRTQIVGLQRQLATTTIYVTHDQTEAMTMGDRIAVMNQGKIQQIAAPLDLYRQPANRFVAAFIGSPPMNFLTVSVKGTQLVHPAFTVPLSVAWEQAIAPYKDHLITLGIRPEHIELGQQPGSIPVTVTQVEALGSETFVLAQLPNSDRTVTATQIQIRIPADRPVHPGSILQVNFSLTKIHLFDSTTEDSIRPL
ncbi:MAG: sugar ABC transporter ATP-binding protein [Leptolyngbya foveolarum]|uniref:Sugar ABC transporter ATP-binding protein n=1 Tax=Leptolyngbya foveolarum TaxID=47253 RepID=A0A2W4UUM7_9CYAN|nr:MAG: sugar ABC transporter ATP-binding protein [Leptolyngbya foveolarum]